MTNSPRDQLRDQLQASLGAAFTLVRELEGGGMSVVFVARETALGRDVVVKVLPAELAQGLSADRFAREIRLAAGLQQAHIVPVLTAGVTANGLPYFTMPFVDGASLRHRMAKGPLSIAESVGVLRDVAQALAYAHGRGIVHRDIKPENVLLSGGSAVVADFGIAKALAAATTRAPEGPALRTDGLTQRGTSIGTPAYMAPEQAAGDPDTDHRADLYAWGVVAYELLAGSHPFAGKTSPHQLIAAHFSETPAALASPPVPVALAALVARCLAKDPRDRPASAGEVLSVLEGATSGATSGAHTGASIGTARTGRRRALVGAVLVVLALGGGAAWWARASARAAAGPDALPLLAVLPFEMSAGAPGIVPDSAFADGLGDAITAKLARVEGLRVIDRASVRSVDDAAARPQATGRTLGADYVLRAKLRWARAADGQTVVQVSPVLVRVSDGTTRWAGEPSVVAPADAFTVQGTLAAEVADALDVALAPAERTQLIAAISQDTAAFAAVERGRRILFAPNSPLSFIERQQMALKEFEFAYGRDPEDAEAWSVAAGVLSTLGTLSVSSAQIDSSAVLARRALALDPGNVRAVVILANYEVERGGAEAVRALTGPALRANPSSASLRSYLAGLQDQVGDTASAWPMALSALRLAPRSTSVIDKGYNIALAQRRYGEASELVVREQALEPSAARGDLHAAQIAAAVGDSVGVARALLAYRAKGERFRADEPPWGVERTALELLQYGGRALGDTLLAGTPATFGAKTADDSLLLFQVQANLLLRRGDVARVRPLLRQGLALSTEMSVRATPAMRAEIGPQLAWFAAAAGDRSAADRGLAAFAADYATAQRESPGGQSDAYLTCTHAEIAGLLGDVTKMLAPLRRCLTMGSGYPVATLKSDWAFARHASDPRVQALAVELTTAQDRARPTPVAR